MSIAVCWGTVCTWLCLVVYSIHLAMFVEVRYVPIAVAMYAGLQYISLSFVCVFILVVLLVHNYVARLCCLYSSVGL